jgi:two-component system, chemotaxis family, sensor kinase CheA
MNEMDEILGEFLAESYEHLDRFDEALHELPGDSPTTVVPDLYRTLHTFKGTCGFFELSKLEAVAHAGEALLSKVRDGHVALDTGVLAALGQGAAALRAVLDHVRATGSEGDVDVSAAVAALETPEHERRGIGELLGAGAVTATEMFTALTAAHKATPVAPEPATTTVPRLGDLLILRGLVTPAQVEAAIAAQRAGDARHLGEILVAHGVVDAADVFEALNAQSSARAGVIGDPTVRVDVAVLNDLLDLITGLAEVCDDVQRQAVMDGAGSALEPTARRLVQITGRLQQGVMRTRMQPIGAVFEKVPRALRTLESQCGKQVVVHVRGAELEVDRTVIEAVKGPLTHLVRNAVDHGIEPPEQRAAKGKPAAGHITLRAYAQDSLARVEVSDDGAGIDVHRLRARAVGMGLMTAAEAADLSDAQALQLIFTTGLSTASAVSTISGRGVGMDAVRASVTDLGGTIDVTTEPGAGTTFTLSFPPSLAMVPALIVADGSARFALPRRAIVEVFALPAGEAARSTLVWRGAALPLIRAGGPGGACDGDVVVVVRSRDTHLGLLVDDVIDAEDVVVKPEDDPDSAAARPVVTADGSIAAVVDVDRLARFLTPAGAAGAWRP